MSIIESSPGHRATMARLRRVAGAARLFSYAAAALMGFGMIWLWSDADNLGNYARGVVGATAAPAVLTPRAYWSALAIGSLPAGLFVYAMVRLAVLFGRFGKGRVLEAGNAVALSRIGWLFVAFGLASPVARALQSVALTIDNPPGQKQLAIGLDPGIFGALAAGAALVAFGLVLREAVRLSDENQDFI